LPHRAADAVALAAAAPAGLGVLGGEGDALGEGELETDGGVGGLAPRRGTGLGGSRLGDSGGLVRGGRVPASRTARLQADGQDGLTAGHEAGGAEAVADAVAGRWGGRLGLVFGGRGGGSVLGGGLGPVVGGRFGRVRLVQLGLLLVGGLGGGGRFGRGLRLALVAAGGGREDDGGDERRGARGAGGGGALGSEPLDGAPDPVGGDGEGREEESEEPARGDAGRGGRSGGEVGGRCGAEDDRGEDEPQARVELGELGEQQIAGDA